MHRISVWAGVLCLSIVSLATICVAQEITGSITGVVHDNSGAILPGTNLVAANVDTGLEIRATTDAEGVYSFPLLRPGKYRVTIEKQGFQRLVRETLPSTRPSVFGWISAWKSARYRKQSP